MNLKEKLGFHTHTYTQWKTIRQVVWRSSDVLAYIIQERTCATCGKVQLRKEYT
jgi:hypothetical protein